LLSASYPGSNGACTDGAGAFAGFAGSFGTWLCAIATNELNTPTLMVVMTTLPFIRALLYFFGWTRAVDGGT
jgi:hypothetical protein